MASIHDILRPITLTKVISRQAAASSWLLNFFGFEPGGANEANYGHGREGSFQVFNNTRTVAQGRAPGAAAGRATKNVIGSVPFTYPRMHEQISLPAELLHNLARIGDPRARDEAGADMIRRQTQFISQKAANWRTAMTVGMLRDSLYLTQNGDTWYPTYTSSGAALRINFQMPAGHLSQLNMLGGGNLIGATWATNTTDIPSHVMAIDEAFSQLYGGRLEYVMLRRREWQYVLNNQIVQGLAGSANQPFETLQLDFGTNPDGSPRKVHAATFVWCPGIKWIVNNDVLEIGAPGSETRTPHIEEGKVLFLPDPKNADIFSGYLGSEPISEYDNGPETVKTGFSAWSTKTSNPTSTNVFVLDNFLPVNHNPYASAYGTVVF